MRLWHPPVDPLHRFFLGNPIGWIPMQVPKRQQNILGRRICKYDKPTKSTSHEHGCQTDPGRNGEADRLAGAKASFSSRLMTHNTKVAIFTLALGMTWGLGTLIMLFYNGVILGAVALDYVLAGETTFLLGWLLPHGVIEIPAIILAGQCGLVLAGALIGWGKPISLKMRFRKISADLVTLIFGVAVMLTWAGIVEALFSQYHEPVLPYELKIGFGVLELILLVLFFARSGRRAKKRISNIE